MKFVRRAMRYGAGVVAMGVGAVAMAAPEAAIDVADATGTITAQLTSVKTLCAASLVALAVIAGVRLIKRAF